MNQGPQPEYEAPSVEEVDTEDAPTVTAAGTDTATDSSDLRLKHSVRSLDGTEIVPKSDYEAPSVEEVDTDDAPTVTAAGDTTAVDRPPSDERLKHSVRPLERTENISRSAYEAPSVEEVETEDEPAVTAAGDDTRV